MILVIAGSYVEFLDYCRESGLDPNSRPRTVKYIHAYSDFFGMEGVAEVVKYGDYYENPICKNPDLWNFLVEYGKVKKWKIT